MRCPMFSINEELHTFIFDDDDDDDDNDDDYDDDDDDDNYNDDDLFCRLYSCRDMY